MVRVADRRVLEVNDGFEQMTGYAREEVLGSSINDLNLWNEFMDDVGDTETIALADNAPVAPSGVVRETVEPAVKFAPVSVTTVTAGPA